MLNEYFYGGCIELSFLNLGDRIKLLDDWMGDWNGDRLINRMDDRINDRKGDRKGTRWKRDCTVAGGTVVAAVNGGGGIDSNLQRLAPHLFSKQTPFQFGSPPWRL